MWKIKSQFAFFLIVLIGVVVVLQMGLYLSHALFQTNSNVNLFQYCLNIIKDSTKGHFSVKLMFNFLIGYMLLFVVWRATKQIVLTQKLKRKMNRLENTSLSAKVNELFKRKKQDIIVIQNPTPVAMTMGLFSPKIVISTGLMIMLDDRELQAVILHEEYHQKHFDPLKAFIITLFSDSIRFVPIMKGLVEYYKALQELLADQYAIQKMGSSMELGGALLKLMRSRLYAKPVNAVSFNETAVNYRIKQILEPEKSVRVPSSLKLKTTLSSVTIIIILLGMILGGCA